VIGQNHLRPVRHKKPLSTATPSPRSFRHFLQERNRIQHHAVPDDALAGGPQHAAGNELQDKLLPANNDRVPGVVPARIARHSAEALAQHVHNLALAFVAPLGAKHYRRLSSHHSSASRKMARRSRLTGKATRAKLRRSR
jgi:hypothetical protein